MTYAEFDKKYNKRNYKGVVKQTSLINLDGKIIAQGTVEEMDDFCDNECEGKWHNREYLGRFYEGQKVVTTNIGNGDRYARYLVSQLNFDVTF